MSQNPDFQPFASRHLSPTFCKVHLLDLPKCGAKRRKVDARCKAIAMANGRCRLHGGKSTGPRTPEGLAKSKKARWKHGEYSQERKQEHRALKKGMALVLDPKEVASLTLDEMGAHLEALRRLEHKMKTWL